MGSRCTEAEPTPGGRRKSLPLPGINLVVSRVDHDGCDRSHYSTSHDSTMRGFEMTGLGAAIYGGFFALAALWLFMTSDAGSGGDDQGQRPERSNSTSTAGDAE